jgi:hypothetical protein
MEAKTSDFEYTLTYYDGVDAKASSLHAKETANKFIQDYVTKQSPRFQHSCHYFTFKLDGSDGRLWKSTANPTNEFLITKKRFAVLYSSSFVPDNVNDDADML